MKSRIVWSIFGLIVLAGLGLMVTVTTSSAQPRPEMVRPAFGPPSQTGRFTVAHATDARIVILDTVTGQLYSATPEDFKKIRELPKVPEFGQPRPFDREGRDGRRPEGREREDKDGRRPPRRDEERRDEEQRDNKRRDDRREDDRRRDEKPRDTDPRPKDRPTSEK